jgi:hypothetical protein
LIIFGTGFAADLKILTNSSSGEKLGKIGSAITYLFGAMGIFSGLIGIIVGCLYTKAEKCSKICAVFVSDYNYDSIKIITSSVKAVIIRWYQVIL